MLKFEKEIRRQKVNRILITNVNTSQIRIHSFLLLVDVFSEQHQPTTAVFHKAMNFIGSSSELTNYCVLYATYRNNTAAYLKAGVPDTYEGTAGCNE